jgi:hypothetical protein
VTGNLFLLLDSAFRQWTAGIHLDFVGLTCNMRQNPREAKAAASLGPGAHGRDK